jgi:hypothetical protein
MPVYYYIVSYDDPNPVLSDDYIASSIKSLFDEHWQFTERTWVLRSDKSAPIIEYELNQAIGGGRLLSIAISENDRGHWYTNDETAPSWLKSIARPPSDT